MVASVPDMKHCLFIFITLLLTLCSAPATEFLEAGTSPSIQTTWKLYGPDLNGKYGGVNGMGGLEAVSPYQNLFNPVISDARGNVLAQVTNGVVSWTLARPTAYSAVPGYRPVAFGNGVNEAQSSVWHGRAVDVTGLYYFHDRYYDPISGQWLSSDPHPNDLDPNGQSYCGGNPVKYTDPMGLMGKDIGPSLWDQYQQSQQGDAVDAYNQTEAQMAAVEEGLDFAPPSGDQSFSSLVNMIPVVGGLKMWVELDTGFDFVTGQRIQGNDWMQAAMMGLNFLPVVAAAAPEEALIEEQVNIPIGGMTEDATAAARVPSPGEPGFIGPLPGYQYNMVNNPGPLAAMQNNPAANFASGQYNAIVLTEDTVFYRGGTAGKPLGQWFTQTPPTSIAAVRIDSAVQAQWIDPVSGTLIGQSPLDTSFSVSIPKGTTIYQGPVGYQGGISIGGGNQIFISKPWNIPGVNVIGSTPLL